MRYNEFSQEDFWDLEEELLTRHNNNNRRNKYEIVDCRHH